MPCVELHTVSPSARQSATAQCVSIELCICAGARYSVSITVAADFSAASASPRSLSPGGSMKSCRSSAWSRSTTNGSGSHSGASASSPASAAALESAASMATAAPAYCGRSLSTGSPSN